MCLERGQGFISTNHGDRTLSFLFHYPSIGLIIGLNSYHASIRRGLDSDIGAAAIVAVDAADYAGSGMFKRHSLLWSSGIGGIVLFVTRKHSEEDGLDLWL